METLKEKEICLPKEMKQKYYGQLNKQFGLNFDFCKLYSEQESIKNVSLVKEKICSNCNSSRNTRAGCVNFSDDIMVLYEINNNLTHQILRKIIRKETACRNIYFSSDIKTINISLTSEPEILNLFAIFYFYIKNYLKIKKVIFSPLMFNSDLVAFIIFDYLVNNIDIETFVLNSEMKIVEYNFCIFDVLSLKHNLKSLTINIPHLVLDSRVLNNIVNNTPLLEVLEIRNVSKIKRKEIDKESAQLELELKEFKLLVITLKNLKYLEEFTIAKISKFISCGISSTQNIVTQRESNLLLFDLQMNKNFKKFEFSDPYNILNEDDQNYIDYSTNFFSKPAHRNELTLLLNIENFKYFHFINFLSLKSLDIGLLDYTSFVSLISSLKNIPLKNLNLRISNNFKIDSEEQIKKMFIFLNNKEYQIQNFNLFNCKNINETFLIYLIDNFLCKDFYIKSFRIIPFHNIFYLGENDEKQMQEASSYKSEKAFIYYKRNGEELERILFVLQKSKIKEKIKNKNIITHISKFCMKKCFKNIHIENSSDIILVR